MKTSTTSSSRSWGRLIPWTAILALLVLVCVDRGIYRGTGIFTSLSELDPLGTGPSLLELAELRKAPTNRPLVVGVGPSRVFDGFARSIAASRYPDTTWGKVAHPRFDPFVVRAMVDELIDLDPEVVVLVWSELDTHRPLRLEPIPGASISTPGAIADLVQITGPRFAVENRQSLYRLIASSLVETYRYRAAFEQAGFNDAVQFELDARLKPRRALPRIFGEPLLWEGEPNVVSAAERKRIIDSFGPDANRQFVDLSIDFAAEITAGEHSRVQMELIRRTLEKLRAANVQVVLIEGPLHPDAYPLYDRGLRQEFLAFASELEQDDGVHVIRLEDMPDPFVEGDFKDLLHVQGPGTAKLTQVIIDAVRALLPGPAPPGD